MKHDDKKKQHHNSENNVYSYIYCEPIKISADIIFRWKKSKGFQEKGGIIKEDFKYHMRFLMLFRLVFSLEKGGKVIGSNVEIIERKKGGNN